MLVRAVGVAAFSLLLPITFAVIVVLLFVTLSYREVVMVYTRAGGSYVVARENFGVKVAQIAAVALIIDYIVTVAVQVAAGTDAVTSAFPGSRHTGTSRSRSVVVAAHVLRQPARHPRGGPDLRAPDLPVRHRDRVADHHRSHPRRPRSAARPSDPASRGRRARSARPGAACCTGPRSSSCCGPSPTAARR